MPTVPRYTKEIGQQALPQVDQRLQAPIEAFGGGQTVAQGFEQAGQLGETAGKLYADTLRRADDAVIAKKEVDLLHHKNFIDKEIDTNYRGENAVKAPDFVNEQWRKKTDELSKDLSSDYQRQEFQKRSSLYYSNLTNKINTHVVSESLRVEKQNHEALITSFRNEAIDGSVSTNPDGSLKIDKNNIDLFIARQQIEDEKYLKKIGAPDSYRELVLQQNMSKTHEGVVNKILNSSHWEMADQYYEENKSFIKNAEDRERIEKSISIKKLYGTAVKNVDEYTAKGLSFEQQLAEAGKIQSSEIRKETENRVIKLNNAKEQAKKAKIEADTQRAWEYVKINGSLNDVPPSVLSSLPPKDVNSLKSAADGVLSPFQSKTNTQVYVKHMNMTSKELEKLGEHEVFAVRKDMTKEDFARFEKRFRDAKDPAKDVEQSFLIGNKEYILSTMKEHKIPGFTNKTTLSNVANKKSTADVYFKVEKDLEKEFASWADANNKKTPPIEVRNKIVDDYFKKKVYVPGIIFDSEEIAGGVQTSKREDVYVPISKIPTGEVNSLRARAEAQGYFEQGISEAEKQRRVQRAYGTMQLPGATPTEVIDKLKGN